MKTPYWLYDAVFGGPLLSEEELNQWVLSESYPLPALVYSMPKGGKKLLIEARLTKDSLFLEASSKRRILNLPPAEGFLIMPARKEGKGLPHYAANGVGLIRAMQQAILVQRQLDLAALEQVAGGARGELKRNPESLTLRDEVEAFALAIDEVKKNGEAGEALEVWVRLILYRNKNQINAVRLRIVEFLTALTRGGEPHVAYVSSTLIREIYREHSLVELKRFPERIVSALLPLLAGRNLVRSESLHPALSNALTYMGGHFSEQIGLNEVAGACHISASHLARLFKQETGQTVVGYLQRLRIQRACELLATSSLSVLQVSLESGFESVEHFHRVFRRHCGVTPRVYRLTHR